MRVRVFIGSSFEGLRIARTVKRQLSEVADVDLWADGRVFPVGSITLAALEGYASRYDFAVIVLTPDDVTRFRGQTVLTPRDNLVFELGLFMGRLGTQRTLIVCPDDVKMKLPSDLAGLIVARYRATGRRDVLREVAVACERVRDRFEALGISNPNRGALLDATVERMSSLLAQTENVFNEYKTTTAKPVWFENVFAAESHLLSILTEYVNRGEEIRLDWLGMTMRNVWNALPTLLTKLDQRHPKAVHFRTAMISSDWLRTNRINASWTDVSADHEYEAILDFFAQKTAVGKANWTNEIRRYSHMPTVHGGLINDSYLLMGICQWDDNGNLWAGDKPYELFSVGDANRGTERIGIFKGWFDTCWRSAANPTLLRWRPLDDRSSSTTRDVLSFLASLGVASCRPCTLRGPALRDHASRSAVALSSSSPGLPPSPSYP